MLYELPTLPRMLDLRIVQNVRRAPPPPGIRKILKTQESWEEAFVKY
jgi:hypothetical protein